MLCYDFQTQESYDPLTKIEWVVNNSFVDISVKPEEAKVVSLFGDKVFAAFPADKLGRVTVEMNTGYTGRMYFNDHLNDEGYPNMAYFSIHDDIIYLRKKK